MLLRSTPQRVVGTSLKNRVQEGDPSICRFEMAIIVNGFGKSSGSLAFF
jgi:hypothetical protein